MCKQCEEQGMNPEDVQRQRETVARDVAERSGVDLETTLKVMIAIEEFSEEFGRKQREEAAERALASARELNPELFAMLEAAGAEFTVMGENLTSVSIDPSGFAEPAPAHERDVPEPRRGMYL